MILIGLFITISLFLFFVVKWLFNTWPNLQMSELVYQAKVTGVADVYSIVGIIYDDTDPTYRKQSIMTYDDETDTYALDITGSKDELKNKSVRVYARYSDFTYRYIGSIHLQ